MRSMKACCFCLLFIFSSVCAKQPDLTNEIVVKKSLEIMRQHAQFKEMTPQLMKRIFLNFLDELDSTKTYFTQMDVAQWINPTEEYLTESAAKYLKGDFTPFFTMQKRLTPAIERHKILESALEYESLPKDIDPKAFKDAPFPLNEKELVRRIMEYKALQWNVMSYMNDDLKAKTQQRIEKREIKYAEDMLNPDKGFQSSLVYSNILKSFAAALDTHTAYLTPEEATQFMINVQQKLFGIGVQLRDDINGFTVVKILEGGPAAKSKLLKAKDRIIAVDGEPVVGMDITDAVQLIRGEIDTPVMLTVMRTAALNGEKQEEKMEVPVTRGEVVLTETRYKAGYEPFGDGVIAYLRLYSFYQDADSSSAQDLSNALEEIRKKHKIEGVILDLRQNSGGLLSQAVLVTGLFITKGIVVSIKDESGNIQHLRDVDPSTIWNGPLMVLIDRTSASASEIVAQTLQDYGRALIVGDPHSFGKGSFQTFTLDSLNNNSVNPEGEYKVTRGRYYTVSGKTPQLVGVASDVVVPGIFSESEIGEKYAKYPLDNDFIEPNFNDTLSDIPFIHRLKYESLYRFNLQQKMTTYVPYIHALRLNSENRLQNNLNFQNLITELKKKNRSAGEEMAPFGQNDIQLEESHNIMKDLIQMLS